MADSDLSPDGFAACGATPPPEASEADFKSALLREQYRSLARLGPYVHGVVIWRRSRCVARPRRPAHS
jgi:hypothetical protein